MLEYDQHITHGGLTFRLCTEQRDVAGGCLIVSSLRFGRQVVSSRGTRISRRVGRDAGLELAGLMSRQHRRVLAELSRGRFDEAIAATPGTGEFVSLAVASVLKRQGGQVLESGHSERRASLDGIVGSLLDGAEWSAPSERAAGPSALDMAPSAIEFDDEMLARTPIGNPSEFDEGGVTAVGLWQPGPEDQLPQRPAALTGDLATLSVPDLLEFLALSRRTGILSVVSTRGVAEVHLNEGTLCNGVASCCVTLEALLLEVGAVGQDRLRRFSRREGVNRADAALGALLLQEGIIDLDLLQRLLERQLREVVRELVGWRKGRFSFDPAERVRQASLGSPVDLALDVRGVLLDVLRELDEGSRTS